jgi:hypothetical protein
VRYPCNLCMEYHLTHLCPRLAEAQTFVTQQKQVVLIDPFQHGKNLTQASTSTEGGSQETCLPPNNPSSANVYMVRGDSFISTRVHDYSKPSTSKKGKEDDLPSLPLQIEKILTTQTQGPPRITLWWKIYHKTLVRCLLWSSSKVSLLRGNPS